MEPELSAQVTHSVGAATLLSLMYAETLVEETTEKRKIDTSNSVGDYLEVCVTSMLAYKNLD